MKDKVFTDSNVLLYLLGEDIAKKKKAEEIPFSTPLISTQVINENINVSYKQFHLSKEKIFCHIENLLSKCLVKMITLDTIKLGYHFFTKYRYGFYDCLIISSAFENNCNILYSEDLQDGQIIEGKLKIINPFKS